MKGSGFVRFTALCALLSVATTGDALAKKKSKEPPPPQVGWVKQEGWSMACYYPPDFSKMTGSERRAAWGKSIDEMKSQWLGKREDGVSFNETVVDEMETTLLGKIELVEGAVKQNLEHCKKAAAGGGTEEWESWLRSSPRTLTAGECHTPFDYSMFDYLDINTGWQQARPICKDNRIVIKGSSKDKFRITDKGPWITVAGDPDQRTTGAEWPCNVEGCLAGMLVLRFVSEAGVETIIPVGTELVWMAPENGEISFRINDTTFFDNVWFKNGAIQDRTSIEVSGVE